MAYDIGPKIGIDGEKEFRDSISAINAEMRKLGAEMDAVTTEFSKNANSEEALAAKNEVLGRSIDTAKQKLTTLENQLTRQREKLSTLAKTLEDTSKEYGENSTEAAKAQNAYNRQYTSVAKLETQYQKTRVQLAELNNEMEGVSDNAESATQAMNASTVAVGVAAWDGIKTAVKGVADALKDCIEVSMEFDSSVADIAATMGTTVDEIGNLREFSQEMGASTVFTATEAAQALNYMALAGYDANEAMQALPNVLNLAAAGAIDLASASDMVTDAQSALGLSMEESAALVDEMAKTSTKTNTSVAQLGEAILTVGGTAKYMVGGTREINQVLGVLADNSIKGAEGGTKLRNIILSLTSPTEKAAATLTKLGVSVFDAEGNLRQFSAIFPELQASLSQLTDQEQLAALSEIFNSRDIAAAQALLGTTIDRWNELDLAIQGAAGSAQQMADTKLDNLAGDITLLESAADGARIAIADSLTPALRDLTQAGTGIVSVVGELAEDFPLLTKVLAGTTAGMAALTVGMGAMKAASLLSITSIGGLGAALAAAAAPVAPFALAIGGLVTVFTAVSSAMADAKDANEEFLRGIQDTKAELAENVESARQNSEELSAMADAIITLAEAGSLNSIQQKALLDMIDQLNQAVPNLNLAYDEQAGKLNMTAEAVRALAAAEGDRLVQSEAAQKYNDLLTQQMEISRQLTEAEVELEKARAENSAAAEETVENGKKVIQLNEELSTAQKNAWKTVQDLKSQYEALQVALDEIESEYGDVSASLQETTGAIEDTGEAAQESAGDLEELAATAEDLEDATINLAGAEDTLSDALKEQSESGSLSLKTALELIDAGYGAAVAVDAETGAVKLNSDEYIRLTQAKIEDQLASLEIQRQSIQNEARLKAEAQAAGHAGSAYWEMAVAKAAAEKGDTTAVDVQIAALNRLKESLNSYSYSAGSAARATSSASKKIQTQAEKDLATYKTLKSELDHEKAMNLVEEADYYNKLSSLRDQYLKDQANLSEYQKATEEIYKYDQSMLEQRTKLWKDANQNILDLEESYQKELSSRAKEIADSYSLFEEVPERQKVAGTQLIKNLEDQIESIEGFYSSLNVLSERGVSETLIEDIKDMGVGAADELEGLLSLTDEQLTRYSELYQEKQELANQIAMKELQQLREDTNAEIMSQMDDIQNLYDQNAPELGLSFAEGLADGIWAGLPMVEEAARAVANAAMSAGSININRDVEAMMPTSNQKVTSQDIGDMLAGAINAMNTTGTGGVAQPANITIQTRDGIEIARAFLPDIRAADKETPEVLDDQ